jgi:hypothetical protein
MSKIVTNFRKQRWNTSGFDRGHAHLENNEYLGSLERYYTHSDRTSSQPEHSIMISASAAPTFHFCSAHFAQIFPNFEQNFL